MESPLKQTKSAQAQGFKVKVSNPTTYSTSVGKRKVGRPSNMNSSVAAAVRLLHASGLGKRKIAKHLRIGVGTVLSVL